MVTRRLDIFNVAVQNAKAQFSEGSYSVLCLSESPVFLHVHFPINIPDSTKSKS